MLDVSTDIFNNSHSKVQKVSSSINISKLLIILSDGRGIFYEGMETVRNAIKKAMQEQIFIVFLLFETPSNKSSIFDIKMPIFTDGNPVNKTFFIECVCFWIFVYSFFVSDTDNQVVYAKFSVSVLCGAEGCQQFAKYHNRSFKRMVLHCGTIRKLIILI